MSTKPEDAARVAQLDHEELVRREHALAHAIREGWVAALRDLRPDLTRPQARRLVEQAQASRQGVDSLSLHGLDLWQFLDVHLPRGVGRPPGITNIENDEQIREVIRLLRDQKVPVRSLTQVAELGGWTRSALRNYLHLTGKDLRRDFG